MRKLSHLEEELLREHFKTDAEYKNAIDRLDNREPLAYIIGEWYFYDEKYKVNENCLIPRPDTEHLVEYLIKNLPDNAVFADLCTGSGCIAISVLAHRKDVKAVAVDISQGAIDIAKENAALNSVSDRITFICSDVLSDNPLNNGLFNAIVSNPPYIKTDVIDTLEPEVQNEPRIALDGGIDCLDFYKKIYTEYKNNVIPSGFIVTEIGYDQGNDLKKLFGCDIYKDYGGNDRVAVLYI